MNRRAHRVPDRVGSTHGAALLRSAGHAVLLVSLLAGCEAYRFRAATHVDMEAAYLRYLVSYPGGTHAASAGRRVEELRYQAARSADRPLGYRQHLQQYPSGRFAGACRASLARLALAKAETVEQLQLVVERYPGTPEADQAAARLPASLARLALSSREPGPAQEFIDRYPSAPETAVVRRHLAFIRYRAVPDSQLALETFADEFSGTPPATEALSRVEKILAQEIRETRDAELLQEFKVRFPRSSTLPALEGAVARLDVDRAVANVDPGALSRLREVSDVADQVWAWCAKRRHPCEALRTSALQALPFRPPEALSTLRSKMYDPDMLVAWRATASLAWIPEDGAGVSLLELLGSPRLSTVWTAEDALSQWLGRRSPELRRSFIARQLRRPWRVSNEDEAQRRGHLCLLSDGSDREGEGAALLASLESRGGRTLSAGYLLLRHAFRRGRPFVPGLATRFLSAARARVEWLRSAFPDELHQDSVVAGILAERELHALDRILAWMAPVQGQAPPDEVRHAAAALLAEWQAKLMKASPGYQPATDDLLGSVPDRHERGREPALTQLLSHRTPAARLVGQSICSLAPLPACAAALPLHRER